MTCKTDKAAVLHCENSRTMAMVPVIIVIVSWASVNTCAVHAIREETTESKGCKQESMKGLHSDPAAVCKWLRKPHVPADTTLHLTFAERTGCARHCAAKLPCRFCNSSHQGTSRLAIFTWMLNTHYIALRRHHCQCYQLPACLCSRWRHEKGLSVYARCWCRISWIKLFHNLQLIELSYTWQDA